MTVKGEHIVSLNEMKLNCGDKVLLSLHSKQISEF